MAGRSNGGGAGAGTGKPKEFRTRDDLVNACVWCEDEHDRLTQRMRIQPDKFNPKVRVQRCTAFLWSKQVKQDEGNVCDSPYLRVLDRRCWLHIKEQTMDYASAIHVARVAEDAAEKQVDALIGKLAAATAASEAPIAVSADNLGGMSAQDAQAVRAHDEQVQRAALQGKAGALAAQLADYEAIRDRAARIRTVLETSCFQRMGQVQDHFVEQAQYHLRWAYKRAGLKSPFLLPGTLGELPPIPIETVEVTIDEVA